MAREKRKYEVTIIREMWLDGRLIGAPHGTLETYAVSPEKAVNNARYRLGISSQYESGSGYGEDHFWSWVVRDDGQVVLDERSDGCREWMEQR